MDYAHDALGNFARLLSLANKPIPLPFAGIKNRRSLISVNNLVNFTVLGREHPKSSNEDSVICEDEVATTAEIISSLIKFMNNKVPVLYIPVQVFKALFKIFCLAGLFKKVFRKSVWFT